MVNNFYIRSVIVVLLASICCSYFGQVLLFIISKTKDYWNYLIYFTPLILLFTKYRPSWQLAASMLETSAGICTIIKRLLSRFSSAQISHKSPSQNVLHIRQCCTCLKANCKASTNSCASSRLYCKSW